MYLEAIKLSKRYGNFYGLKDLNLKIEGKKCVGYLGPNGAGKTTTLKLFTNLLLPTSGTAIINGYDVKREPKRALESVGAIIETPDFYPYLTAEEILSMACDVRGVSKREIPSVLRRVGLKEWKGKKVGKFSKGMKQRLALGTALVSDPEILILDEPTTGMDPQGMMEVREIIKDLKREGLLIFMSSHLLPEVSSVCDEVAMINRGKLILYDSMENVVRSFTSKSVLVEFLEPVEGVGGIEELDGVKDVEVLGERRLRITFSGEKEAQYRILKGLIEKGYRVLNYQSETMALEEAYIKLVGGEMDG